MPVILDKISKSFGPESIFSDFSLELPDSGCVCFFGPSGSGKTTLFNILAGLLPLDSGSVTFTDKQKVSFAFQEDRLLPWVSAAENVEQVLDTRDAHQLALEWLGRVGLTESAGKLPAELSGGMRQRVALARALAFEGDVLLLDEPFRGIDAQAKDALFALLAEEKSKSLLVLVTHYPEEALRLADTVYVIEGPPVQITDTIQIPEEKRNDAHFVASVLARLGTHAYSSER